jgi:hypothetical protein
MSAAPMLNKVAMMPPEAAQRHPVERERVIAALRFGEALEELVARSRLQPDEADAAAISADPRFPLDLSHRRNPQACLQGVHAKLLESEAILLGALDAGNGSGPAPSPSVEAGVGQKIETILSAYRAQGCDATNLDPLLFSGADGIDEAVRLWDASVVERIVEEPPVLLAAYKVGKALSLTRWQVWGATHRAPGDEAPEAWRESWNRAFGEQRITGIQRHLDVLDPVVTTVVATGLGYWRHALLSLSEAATPAAPAGDAGNPAVRAAAPSEIVVSSEEESERLAVALEEQLANWFDLLTGRRTPESFPVAGIVTTLTKNLTAGWRAWAQRLLIPGVIFALVVAAAVALVLAAMGVVSWIARGEGEPGTGLFGGLGATFGAVLTFLAVRGRALFDRGSDAVDRLRERIDELEEQLESRLNRVQHASDRTTAALGLRRVVWRDLGEDVLSSVVKQIRLEELNLAVSDPLVRFVLDRDGGRDANGDPREDIKTFLRLAYGNRSNLDRLEPVFEELYKNLWGAPRT